MDPRYRQQQGPGLPSGPQSGVRPPQRPSQNSLHSATSSAALSQPGQMTRAERFEEEKRRIIESCFFKTDDGGQLAESYITHIRVTEDSSYPQTPHPPDSPSANKERMIIVAVKNTGRVRLHKARENANRSFSIGKTWNMEELTGVMSWSHFSPRSEEEAQLKSWAGDVGFTVTIAKQYYWQAGTEKEKEFFIASLVKIFRKYTQGKLPELRGFSPRELEQMTGSSASGSASSSRVGSGASPGRPLQPPPFSPDRGLTSANFAGQRSLTQTDGQTFDSNSGRPMPGNRPTTSNSDRSNFSQGRSPSALSGTPPSGGFNGWQDPGRQPRLQPSRDGNLRQQNSRDPLMPPRAAPPTNGSFTSQASSRSEFGQQRIGTPDSPAQSRQAALNQADRSPSRTPDALQIQKHGEQAGPNGLGIGNVQDRWRPNGAPPVPPPSQDVPMPLRPANGATVTPKGSQTSLRDQPVPERRRPFMTGAQMNGSQSILNKGPTSQPMPPTPTKATQQMMPPPASRNNSSQPMPDGRLMGIPGAFVESPAPSDKIEKEGLIPLPLKPSAPPAQVEPPTVPLPAKPEPEPTPITKDTSALSDGEAKDIEQTEDGTDLSRPGLGPMFGAQKKSARDLFKSAANKYGAFVPRAGGAAAKLKAGEVSKNEPDGISGVVPAPGLLRSRTDESMKADSPATDTSIQATPTSALAPNPNDKIPPPAEPVPEVTVSSPISPSQEKENALPVQQYEVSKEVEAEVPVENAQQKKAKADKEETARRKKRRSQQQNKYLSVLGVDSAALENRGLDFEMMLDDFGWGTDVSKAKTIEALEADIRREISRVEAGSWLGHLEQKDDRVEAVEILLDQTIAEVDELDGLLTLYSVELGSLNDDIAFIEAQSQGLQVQTANQKLLQAELQSLVDTISITPRQLEALKRATPSNRDGLDSIEQALLLLYKAMVTIDPTIRQGSRSQSNAGLNSELSTMVALREKGGQYLSESITFLSRFTEFMRMGFPAAFMQVNKSGGAKLSIESHDAARAELWQYSPIMLFAKEIDPPQWEALLVAYQKAARDSYQDEFTANGKAWKQFARKSTGDEQEILFTFNEKEDAGLTGTARKLTVKRSQTLARGLRTASGEKSATKSIQSGTLWPFEAFSGAMDEMIPLIFMEQNFIVDYFHATGTQYMDFADAVAAAPPESRRGTNLRARKAFEPDRNLAARITAAMADMYSFFPKEINDFITWAVRDDPLQGIGIMHALCRNNSFEDTNQEFLTKTLTGITNALASRWNKFVDEQIRAIEDTKVKIKKRKGVIGFIKIFPNFSAAIENMLPSALDEPASISEVRRMVDVGYGKINKAMFESLSVIAKGSPGMAPGSATAGGLSADPEDKEALNYQILLIENMNHYVEEVETRGDSVLEDGKREAQEEMEEHLGRYVDTVLRRPLGRVMDFLDSIGHAVKNLPIGTPPTAIATKSSTSTSAFRKLIQSTDQKELRKGVEALKKRVEKHFGDADDLNLSRHLVGTVMKHCEGTYVGIFQQVQDAGREIYEGEAGDGVLATREEVARWFRPSR
ncbi:hypothetical protein Vi05172_g12968 [Venturia inaequalis]|uniref:Exocyst complex component Sec3 PIP2-binding N-terminal domain-containing protein n=1 Tax=Venturia inaequalis TaxID=5025 RepID=A0A8H3ZFA1_VENIN|nr:hypothetical protein EG327_001955 [Venturia inaequalis]RDI77061.1 hypothetical protein Vi05172_g12968 [Venturia inaequalis]